MIVGLFAAGILILIVLGSIILAFAEGDQTGSIASFPTLESIDLPTSTSSPTQSRVTMTSTATETPTQTITLTPSPTLTRTSTEDTGNCEPPSGWFAYTVKTGDTLNELAAEAGIDPQALADANCLAESRLVPGSTLYLPPAQSSSTPFRCGPPANWVIYIVQPGDTLYNISLRVGATVNQLIDANCISSDSLRIGQQLYVPRQPAPIPSPTKPPAATKVPIPTSTPIPTATPTDSNISRLTPVPTSPTP